MSKKKIIVKREHKIWETKELDYLKHIGTNIIRIKKEKNLTSKYIYETLEIDKSNYRRIESGKSNISILLLNRIANVLNIHLEELLK